MTHRIDVLNLEWTSTPSRDRVMATLVCNYLRMQGLRVEEQSVFDGYHALNNLKPKLLFMTNTTGAPENLDLMRYAKTRGYLGVSLISEGNFTRDSANHQEMIWGWNKQKKLAEDIYLLWSERTRVITLQHHPELKERVGVSGGVGFDNYRIGKKQQNQREFLSFWKKEGYEKIIGIGCFDFGNFYPEDYRYAINLKSFTNDQNQRFRNDGVDFDRVLTSVASKNLETLFIVKQHPGSILGHKASGTVNLSNLPNVLVIKNELSIFDCIALSDFWVAYESTTAMEAWLMGKQTCLLNPSGRDFPRDIVVSEGSPAYVNVQELMHAIEGFYTSAALPGFLEREDRRRQIIKQTIQWDDGLNHVRAGNAVLDLLESSGGQQMLKEAPSQRQRRWKQHVKWVLSPIIYRIRPCYNESANRRNFVNADLKKFCAEKFQDQLDFYQSRNLKLEQLRQIQGL
jgi:surface carbohydrate biosynthesis protein